MGFQIRYEDGTETTQVVDVDPAPSAVDYPQRQHFKKHETEDGAVVIQRYEKDQRPRKWIWGMMSDRVDGYSTLWSTLNAVETSNRLAQGLDPIVEVREDFTATGD